MWSHTSVSLYSSSVAKSNTNHYGSVGPMFVADLPPQMSVFVSHSWTRFLVASCLFKEHIKLFLRYVMHPLEQERTL